jgi:hypothetical protein
MYRLSVLILFLIISSCNPKLTSIYVADSSIYGELKNGQPDADTLIVKMNQSDTLAIGKYAVTDEGQIEYLKTGYWKVFHDIGSIKEEGEYKIGSLIDCCFSGACARYYHYKSGIWKYYDEDGEELFELNFQPDTLHVDTRCQGGDQIVFGLIKDFSKLEYKYKLTPDDIYELQKVVIEDEESQRKTVAIPISGELVFRSIEK